MHPLTVQAHLATLTVTGGSLTLVRHVGGSSHRPSAGWRERMIPLEAVIGVELEPCSLLRQGTLTLRFLGPQGEQAQPEVVRFGRSQSAAVQTFADALRGAVASAPPDPDAAVAETLP